MVVVEESEITRLLAEARAGNGSAWGEIVRGLYQDLRQLAHGVLGPSQGARTLNTTGLVHEAWLRLAQRGEAPIRDRAHFFSLAAVVMRQVVCDYARERLAAKRGAGAAHLSLSAAERVEYEHARRFVDVDEALARLAAIAPRRVKVVECRFFLGLTDQETAEALGTSVRTVRREWALARDWLREAIADES